MTVQTLGSNCILKQEVTTLLEIRAIEIVELWVFYSMFFIVPEKDGSYRPIVKVLPLHMLIIAKTTACGYWLGLIGSIDVNGAYFHVPVTHHRWFLCFSTLDRVHKFKVLPFNLSLSPEIFTQCVQQPCLHFKAEV